MTTTPSEHPRYSQAIWYAWGQQDAGIGKDADALQFALAHARHAMRMDSGEVNYLPSIQDAWKTWLGPQPMATNLSTSEISEIQRKLRAAMNALDACGQDDLSGRAHAIFKEVARRAFEVTS